MLKSCNGFSSQKHTGYHHFKIFRYGQSSKVLCHNPGPIFHKDRTKSGGKQKQSWLTHSSNIYCYVIRGSHIVATDFRDLSIWTTMTPQVWHSPDLNVFSTYNDKTKLNIKIQLNQLLTKIILTMSNCRCAMYIRFCLQNRLNSSFDTTKCNTPFISSVCKPFLR